MQSIENKVRNRFDFQIEKLVDDIARSVSSKDINEFDPKDILDCSDNLGYVITKICSSLVTRRSLHSKTVVLLGVLENVKQELHRRAEEDQFKEDINLLHSS